jgi:periplasmic protein TonB
MFDLKTFVAKTGRGFFKPVPPHPDAARQRHLMMAALALLLVCLGLVFYWDRNFWFPNSSVAESQSQPDAGQPSVPVQSVPVQSVPVQSMDRSQPQFASAARNKSHNSKPASNVPYAADPSSRAPVADAPVPDSPDPNAPVTVTRTVLPPLEIEVVAGDEHRAPPAASNSVRVDLQSGTPPQTPAAPSPGTPDTAASTTAQAAERVEMPANAPAVVSRSVKPDYPLLARQMKVQGSVMLRALISRDGQIQELHVLSGPPILAHAAQEAVRQWHFKPHYVGAEAVETQAKITVNFTISTN